WRSDRRCSREGTPKRRDTPARPIFAAFYRRGGLDRIWPAQIQDTRTWKSTDSQSLQPYTRSPDLSSATITVDCRLRCATPPTHSTGLWLCGEAVRVAFSRQVFTLHRRRFVWQPA